MQLFLQEIVSAVLLGGIYALVAVSLNFVFSVSGVVQLAQGDIMILGAYAGFVAATFIPNLLLALCAGVAITAFFGFVINDAIFRWLRSSGHLILVAGLALSAIIEEGLRILFFQGNAVAYPAAVVGRGAARTQFQIVILVLAVGLGLVFQVFLSRSKHGRALRATADDPEVARLHGIPVGRMIRLSFVIGSALAGAAGVLFAVVEQYITPFIGADVELIGVAIILFGGLGSIPGAIIGSFILSASQVFATAYISTTYRDAIAFALIVVVMIVRPRGIMGREEGARA